MFSDLENNSFALDISDHALRVLQIHKMGKKAAIRSFGEVTLKDGLIEHGEIKQPEVVAKQISQLVANAKGAKITGRNVITVLPEPKTFIKIVDATVAVDASDEEMLASIQEEVKRHVPLELDQTYFDWQQIERKGEALRAMVGIAPKDIVDSYVATIEAAGFSPIIFEIEAAAILRALTAAKDTKAKIIIDFGAARTGLIVYAHGGVQFTVSLPISGQSITTTIQNTLKLEHKDAERAKIVCGLDDKKCDGALRKVLFSSIDDLTERIKKAMTYYKRSATSDEAISEVVLCGGGANFLKIDEVLSGKLNLPVRLGNPLSHINEAKTAGLPANKVMSYSTAIGLALRSLEPYR